MSYNGTPQGIILTRKTDIQMDKQCRDRPRQILNKELKGKSGKEEGLEEGYDRPAQGCSNK